MPRPERGRGFVLHRQPAWRAGTIYLGPSPSAGRSEALRRLDGDAQPVADGSRHERVGRFRSGRHKDVYLRRFQSTDRRPAGERDRGGQNHGDTALVDERVRFL